jgi:hypothetical protein
LELIDDGHRLDWHIEPTDHTKQYGLTISASTEPGSGSTASDPIGAICVGASIGVSPDHHDVLEAARMTPNHRRAQLVHVDDLQSEFLAQFTTAEPAPSYLMRDVDVVWTRERAPRTSREGVSA